MHIYTHTHTYIYTCINIYTQTRNYKEYQKVFNKLVLTTNYKYLAKA